jgi:AraC-like DNA-binding protein
MSTTLATRPNISPCSVVDDPRWVRIVERDRSADGQLWYSVMTTGIYCRPSCPSRTANPKNVQLHDSLAAAKATGFRACKRCNPDGQSVDGENTALVAQACRMIEASEEEPSLNALAAAVGRSASYFHRVFKATTGRHAQGLCDGAPRREGAGRPGQWHQRDRGDVRCRLQFERPLLREVDRHARDDAHPVPLGGSTRRSISPWGKPPLVRSWWPRARRASRRSCWARIRISWSAICRIASPRPR